MSQQPAKPNPPAEPSRLSRLARLAQPVDESEPAELPSGWSGPARDEWEAE